MDNTLGNDATVTVHRYPDPTPVALKHLIVVCAVITSHCVAVSVRPVLPPLYTATSGAIKSPTPGLGPKLVPVSTMGVFPDVCMPVDADVMVGTPYVVARVDHDPF
jgi:hypothetical protein